MQHDIYTAAFSCSAVRSRIKVLVNPFKCSVIRRNLCLTDSSTQTTGSDLMSAYWGTCEKQGLELFGSPLDHAVRFTVCAAGRALPPPPLMAGCESQSKPVMSPLRLWRIVMLLSRPQTGAAQPLHCPQTNSICAFSAERDVFCLSPKQRRKHGNEAQPRSSSAGP